MGHKTNGQSQGQGRGALTRSRCAHPPKRQPAKKIFNKKGEVIGGFTEADLERDKRDEQEWLKQGDLTPDAREAGREAAYVDLTDFELCRDLGGKFARESAKRTSRDIAEIRDRYETIVLELRTVRYTHPDGKRYSLSTALRSKYETDEAFQKCLPKFGNYIGEYVSDCIREHSCGFTPLYRQIVPTHTWTLCGHSVSRELLTALREEYIRDRVGLMRFLLAVFKQWRKILEPRSAWRVRLVTQQCASGVSHHKIAQYLARISAVSKDSSVPTTKEYALLRSRIKQIRSREQKAAFQRRQKNGDKNG